MKVENIAGAWLFLLWTLVLIIVVSVIGYNGLYGQDSYEYLRYSNRLHDFIDQGIQPGDYFWPVNYPLIGALLSFITGQQIALQLISIVAASWILYLVCMFLFREFPGREREVIIYVVLLLGLCPYFFRYSISAMSDIPALSFACAACYALYRGYKHNHAGWLYTTGFFISMAVFTRFAYLPFLFPVALFSGYSMIKKFRLFPFIASVLIAIIPLALYLFFKQNNSSQILQHYLVSDWSFYNLFKTDFNTIDGYSQYKVPNIIFVFSFLVHPGFLFPGILFLVMLFKNRIQPSLIYPVIAAGAFCYLMFIAGIPNRNVRYLVPVMPFYLVVCFPGFLLVLSWFFGRMQQLKLIYAAAILLQLTLAVRAFLPFLQFNRLEKRVSEKMLELHPKVLYTFGIDGALRSYGYEGTIINLWDQQLDSIQKGAHLLFNKKENELQWSGRNPMLNYSMIIDKAKAVKIEELESGWEIYEIKEAYPYSHTGIPEKQ